MTTYRFGLLAHNVTYRLAGCEIDPLPEFEKVQQWAAQYAHKDGFIYPPTSWTNDEHGRRSPNTERPAHLHKLPPSHELRLNADPAQEDRHRADGSFIIQLTGYLHGTYLQFDDWWFDTRVPLRKGDGMNCTRETAEHFLSHAYKTWQSWTEEPKKRFTNILYMFNRAPSYEWDWEHFLIEYMLLDTCYRTAEDVEPARTKLKGAKAKLTKPGNTPPHSMRIQAICDAFGLQWRADITKLIVDLRNDLFHEALWDGAQPGTAPSHYSFHAPLDLRRLNQRLILALLGYSNDYMRTAWWGMGTHQFRKP